jgi:hypothetical protein
VIKALQTHKTPLLSEWRLAILRWSLASQHFSLAGGLFHRTYRRLPRPVCPFEGCSMAITLAGCLLYLWLADILSGSRYITGTLLIAIEAPFVGFFLFSSLWK